MATRRTVFTNDFRSPMKRKELRMTFLKEFSIKTEVDEVDCKTTSVVVLEVGAIIVTDIENGLTKAFDMDGNYLDSIHRGRPFGLVVISHNEFVVTVYTNKTLAFCRLTDDNKIELTKSIETEKRYFGIAKLSNDNFLMGTKRAVDIMTPDGAIQGRMTSEFDIINAFHIAVTKAGDIIVVDSEKVCLLVFDKYGYLQRLVHLGYILLRGIAVVNDVVFYLNNKKDHVFMIPLKGDHVTLIRADKKRLVKPTALCVLPDGRVVISEEQKIKIFRIDDYEKIISVQGSKLRRVKTFLLSRVWKNLCETIGLLGLLELSLAFGMYTT